MLQRFLRRGHICAIRAALHCATSAQAQRKKGGQCVRAPDCSNEVTIRGWNLTLSIQNRNKYTCRGVYTKIRRCDSLSWSANIWREQGLFPEIACEGVVSLRVFTATFSRTRRAPRKLFLCFSCLQGQQTYYDPLQSDTESLAGYESSAESGLGDKI